MDRWIDTDTMDRYYQSILLVMVTTDSIDPSVKDFFFLSDSIDHWSQNPCSTDDHQSISSHSADGIDPSVKNRFHPPIFLNEGKSNKYSLIIGRAKYHGLKGQYQKICCSELLNEENKCIFFNKKLHRIRGLKGMCQNKMKRNYVYDSSSFYYDTFPLILVFFAACYWRLYLCFLLLTVCSNISFDTVSFYRHYIWLGIIGMDRFQYYRSILLIMLDTNIIDSLVKNFSFLTNSIDHQSPPKFFFRLNRTIS
jgi:hypothetical protein